MVCFYILSCTLKKKLHNLAVNYNVSGHNIKTSAALPELPIIDVLI